MSRAGRLQPNLVDQESQIEMFWKTKKKRILISTFRILSGE